MSQPPPPHRRPVAPGPWGASREASASLRGVESWLVMAIFTLVGVALLAASLTERRWPAAVAGVCFIASGLLARRAARAHRRRTDAISDVDAPSFLVNRPRDYLPEIRSLLGAIGLVAVAAATMALTA